jgi:hypothetical protein
MARPHRLTRFQALGAEGAVSYGASTPWQRLTLGARAGGRIGADTQERSVVR